MNRVYPLRIGLNLCECLVGERLHPPGPTFGIQNYLLPRGTTDDASFNNIDLVRTVLCRRRDPGEFNGWSRNARSGVTTTCQDANEAEQSSFSSHPRHGRDRASSQRPSSEMTEAINLARASEVGQL